MKEKKSTLARNIDGVIKPITPPKISTNNLFRTIILIIFIVLIAIVVFVISKQGTEQPKSETSALKATIEKHYVLPTNEEPVVATITDTTKLSSAFQGKANNGDRLLIYQKNQQAIVYRPSIDRVVNVVPVQIDTPQGGTAPQ